MSRGADGMTLRARRRRRTAPSSRSRRSAGWPSTTRWPRRRRAGRPGCRSTAIVDALARRLERAASRSQLVRAGGVTIVDDTYNASPGLGRRGPRAARRAAGPADRGPRRDARARRRARERPSPGRRGRGCRRRPARRGRRRRDAGSPTGRSRRGLDRALRLDGRGPRGGAGAPPRRPRGRRRRPRQGVARRSPSTSSSTTSSPPSAARSVAR